jgi:hypothetical protein
VSDDWGNDPLVKAEPLPKAKFSALMDKTFGAGAWKLTGGYRSKAREDQLRREGAATVPPGKASAHSKGDEEEPGAYDIVVPGMSPKMVAKKLAASGAVFDRLYPEDGAGSQGAHLHVQPAGNAAPGEDWGNDPLVTPGAPAPSRKPLSAGPTELRAGPKPGLDQFNRDVAGFTASAVHEDLKEGRKLKKEFDSSPWQTLNPVLALKQGGNALALLTDPAKGLGEAGYEAMHDMFLPRISEGDPEATLRGQVGDLAAMAVPLGGGEAAGERAAARLAKAAEEEAARLAKGGAGAAKSGVKAGAKAGPATVDAGGSKVRVPPEATTPDAVRAARVKRLKDAGVEVTNGQAKGGQAKRVEEALESHPLVGNAFREHRALSITSFNAATYDKALAPLDRGFPREIPPGRDGVAYVEKKIGEAYDQILPQVQVRTDKQLMEELAAVERASAKLGPTQKAQFGAIVKQDVLSHFGTGDVVDGRTFKMVESQLSRQARGLKGSADYNMRATGELLDDVLDSIRSAAERSSGKAVQARLRKVNEAWAIFTRVQDASVRRAASGGVFTPMDLMQAVKKGDRSVRKGAFARGDALLQDWADDAAAILPNELPNSGTADRMNLTKDGLIESAVSPVTNHLARRVLAKHAARNPASAVAGVARRVSPMVDHRIVGADHRIVGAGGAGLNALNTLTRPGDQ